MATTTTNISLTKPEATDTSLIREDINANSDIVDGRFSSVYMAIQAKASVDIDGGSITGITDLLVADGGTGASSLTDGGVLLGSGTGAITAMAVLTDGQMIVGNGTTDPVAESGATLRASIGVTIGTHVQAFDNALTSISGLTYVSASFIKLTANDTYAVRTLAQTLTDIGGAASGANTDITSLTGLTTPLSAAYGGTGVANNVASTLTISGNFATTITVTEATGITLPASGTLVNTAVTSLSSLATIGTVTSGTLSTGAVLADVTMTLGTDVDGDVYYRASNKLTRLAKGSATQVLTMNAGETAPEWAAAGGGYTNLTSFVDQTAFRVFYSNTAGDVIELALGADGTYLKSNGAAANPSFAVPSGAGDVSKVGTPVNDQVGVWTGDGTIEGHASFTYASGTGTVTATEFVGGGAGLTGANTGFTSILNAGLYVGRDADNQIKFATDNKIIFRFNAADRIEMLSTGELDMNAGTIGFTQQTVSYNVTTTTVDWKLGNKATMTFGAGNIGTFAFTNPTNPCNVVLKVIQDGTGSRVVTAWDADIKWVGGSAPTLTTGANTIDVISFYWDGTNYFGVASLAFS